MFVRGSARDHLDNIQAALSVAWRSPTTVTTGVPNTLAAEGRDGNRAWRAAAASSTHLVLLVNAVAVGLAGPGRYPTDSPYAVGLRVPAQALLIACLLFELMALAAILFTKGHQPRRGFHRCCS